MPLANNADPWQKLPVATEAEVSLIEPSQIMPRPIMFQRATQSVNWRLICTY